MAENLPDTKVGNIEYISKQDAVSRISDLLVLELKMTRCPTWNEVYNAIGDLPPADVAPVGHGHWTLVGWHKGMKIMECSCCKKRAIGATDFCPNCGAKMDKE